MSEISSKSWSAPIPKALIEVQVADDESRELSQYSDIPRHILQRFVEQDDDEISIAEDTPRRRFYYPGADHGDDGLEGEAKTECQRGRRTDELPKSDDQLPIPDPELLAKVNPWARKHTSSQKLDTISDVPDAPILPLVPKKTSSRKNLSRRSSKSVRPLSEDKSGSRERVDKRVYCAACEVPIKKAKKILGNIVCLDCAAKVHDHELCTACFGHISDKQGRTVVFRKGHYCPHCAKRVILYCSHCRQRFPLRDIARGHAAEIEGKPYCQKCSSKRQPQNPKATGDRLSKRVSKRVSKVGKSKGRLVSRRSRRNKRF